MRLKANSIDMGPKFLSLIIVIAAMLTMALPLKATVPRPEGKISEIVIFDGPGPFCAAVLSINLAEGEFAIARRRNSWSVQYQIELEEGRIMLFNSSSGQPPDDKTGIKVGEGRLTKSTEENKTFYFYDDGSPGVTILNGLGRDKQKKQELLSRIRFSSPRYSSVNDEPCLRGHAIK